MHHTHIKYDFRDEVQTGMWLILTY